MATKPKKKSFFKMTPSERDADVRKFDKGLSFEQLRPLSAKNQLLWEAAKRPRGRPRLGKGAVRVLVTLDPALLEQVDRYVTDRHLKRSQLIARALKNEMNRAS
jgi:hypothetical protein